MLPTLDSVNLLAIVDLMAVLGISINSSASIIGRGGAMNTGSTDWAVPTAGGGDGSGTMVWSTFGRFFDAMYCSTSLNKKQAYS